MRRPRPGWLEASHLVGEASFHRHAPFALETQIGASLADRAFLAAFHLSTTAGTAACRQLASISPLVAENEPFLERGAFRPDMYRSTTIDHLAGRHERQSMGIVIPDQMLESRKEEEEESRGKQPGSSGELCQLFGRPIRI